MVEADSSRTASERMKTNYKNAWIKPWHYEKHLRNTKIITTCTFIRDLLYS